MIDILISALNAVWVVFKVVGPWEILNNIKAILLMDGCIILCGFILRW